MKVSGFTFLRNGTVLGYPYLESIRSLLPLVDEFVVNVGKSDDDTLDRVRAIGDPKIRVIESQWNERMTDRGFVYAQQKMIAHYNCTGDWAFYLEADEVVHEEDIPTIRSAMERHLGNPEVEALAFDYLHFYGAPSQLAVSPAWYRRAVRVIRNTIRTYSPDGLYFIVAEGNRRVRYPRAALAGAPIYHYGHVRSVERMKEKMRQVSRYWGHEPPKFEDYSAIDPQALKPFTGTHPASMSDWLVREAEREFHPNPAHAPGRRDRRHRLQMKLESALGLEFSKKHFTLVRK